MMDGIGFGNDGILGTNPGGDRRLLGLDEAGRGSVIGPLVVGGFAVQESRVRDLTPLGVRDSKLLSPDQREAVYTRIEKVGTCFAFPIAPRVIDRWVRRNGLNELEAQTFARIVQRAHPDATFADACDPVARRFGARIARWARCSAPIYALHHADRDLVVVSAASVVAKVNRDRAIARLKRRLGVELGSGYPSDPQTVAHVRAALERSGALPEWIRGSWATTERLKPKRTAGTLEAFVQ